MSQTKHKMFKIKISDDGKFVLDRGVQRKINAFLAEDNYIYVNHSVTVLTEDIEVTGEIFTINKFLVISIIYKDLNESEYNLKGTSKTVKKVVTKEIEIGVNIPKPQINTTFDTEIQKLKKSISKNKKNTKLNLNVLNDEKQNKEK